MADGMRIVVIGQAAFGEAVLNALVAAGEDVVGVVCAPDKEGKAVDAIKVAAEGHGIAVHQFKRMRDREAIDGYRALKADLGVMAFVTDIVPMEILEAPSRGTIQYHPSLLPKHRGPSSINWPIIQGDAKTGLSIFWPDEGLDTGPILLQKETAIGPDDTLGSVYFKRLFPKGVEAMVESVAMVRAGTAPKLVQDESEATYEGWCRATECAIDWSRPVAEVHNLIRGADPSPGAGTTCGGGAIQVYDSSKSEDDSGAEPGVILDVSDAGVRIAASGGSVLVGRIRGGEVGKVGAAEWAKAARVKAGDRVGG